MSKNFLEIVSRQLFNLKFYKFTNLYNKIIGLLFNKHKNLYYKYKFYYRKNKIYCKNFLKNIYPPKIFIVKNIYFDQKIFEKIKKYQFDNVSNKYDYAGHLNIYQSLHNLNEDKDFHNIGELIKQVVNKKIIQYYQLEKKFSINIEKLWFTITKKSGKMKKHHHLDGDLSGVFYLKCDNTHNSGFINLYNYQKNLRVYEADNIHEKFKEKKFNEKKFKYKPQEGDLIIFDSYVDHEVDNSDEIKDERISMPCDISINFSD
jgi:uncharacterized protein (TIGR02466 family)